KPLSKGPLAGPECRSGTRIAQAGGWGAKAPVKKRSLPRFLTRMADCNSVEIWRIRRVAILSRQFMTSKTSVGALFGAIAGASLLFCCLGTSARADSIPYPNPGTVNPATYNFTAAFTGDVIAFFARNSASFENVLGLQINGVSTGIFGLDNLTSHVGDSVNLGFAHAGDTLTFVMRNIVPGNGDLFSNPALNGPYDGLAVGTQHIYSTSYTATSPIFGSIPVGVFVAFEDLRFRDSNFN